MDEDNPYLHQKYSFYEIVIIRSQKERLSQYNGKRGFIAGKLHPDDYTPGFDSKTISYAVRIEGVLHGWCVDEDELEYTGEFVDPENAEEMTKWWPPENRLL